MEIVHGPVCIKPSIRYRDEGKLDQQRTNQNEAELNIFSPRPCIHLMDIS